MECVQLLEEADQKRHQSDWNGAYECVMKAVNMEYKFEYYSQPLIHEAFAYKRWHLLGIIGWYAGHYSEGEIGCREAIAARKLDIDRTNLQYYLSKQNYETNNGLSTLFKKYIERSEIAIVIQGLSTHVEEQKLAWKDFANQVVFSTWKGEEHKYTSSEFDVIFSEYPSNRGVCNLNLQKISTLNGIAHMEKKGFKKILKWRSDIVPTNPHLLLMNFLHNIEKLQVFSYYLVRDSPTNEGYYVDYFMCAPVEMMKTLWSIDAELPCPYPEYPLTKQIQKMQVPVFHYMKYLNRENNIYSYKWGYDFFTHCQWDWKSFKVDRENEKEIQTLFVQQYNNHIKYRIAIALRGVHFMDNPDWKVDFRKSTRNFEKFFLSKFPDSTFFLSTYNSPILQEVQDYYKPRDMVVEPNESLTLNSFFMQIKHCLNLCRMIRECKETFDYCVFTRFDIYLLGDFDSFSVDKGKFNTAMKHSSGNSDDMFWFFPFCFLDEFETHLKTMLATSDLNTHRMNVYFGDKTHYMYTITPEDYKNKTYYRAFYPSSIRLRGNNETLDELLHGLQSHVDPNMTREFLMMDA